MLFRIDYYRLVFYKLSGVNVLITYLEGTLSGTASKDQMQYQVIFCLWLLTFNEQIASRIQNKYETSSTHLFYSLLKFFNHMFHASHSNMVIPILADVLNATEKEKVKRIILATFKVTILYQLN